MEIVFLLLPFLAECLIYMTPRCSHYEGSLGGEVRLGGRGDSVSGVTAWARHPGTRTPHPAWGQSDPDTLHVWDDTTD